MSFYLANKNLGERLPAFRLYLATRWRACYVSRGIPSNRATTSSHSPQRHRPRKDTATIRASGHLKHLQRHNRPSGSPSNQYHTANPIINRYNPVTLCLYLCNHVINTTPSPSLLATLFAKRAHSCRMGSLVRWVWHLLPQ